MVRTWIAPCPASTDEWVNRLVASGFDMGEALIFWMRQAGMNAGSRTMAEITFNSSYKNLKKGLGSLWKELPQLLVF